MHEVSFHVQASFYHPPCYLIHLQIGTTTGPPVVDHFPHSSHTDMALCACVCVHSSVDEILNTPMSLLCWETIQQPKMSPTNSSAIHPHIHCLYRLSSVVSQVAWSLSGWAHARWGANCVIAQHKHTSHTLGNLKMPISLQSSSLDCTKKPRGPHRKPTKPEEEKLHKDQRCE